MTSMTTSDKSTKKSSKASNSYIEAVGRRKTAVARVRATVAPKNSITVNDKPLEEYFATEALRAVVASPVAREGFGDTFAISVKVAGGGVSAQAEAIRHGIARILVKDNVSQKSELKKLGFLRRDSREVERKHFGLKKARKASQWSKR